MNDRPPAASRALRRFVGWFLEHLYTDLAWLYDAVAGITSVGQWWTWQQVIEAELPDGMLLELGHGTGRLLARQLSMGRDVVGIDRSSDMSRIAARRLRRQRLPLRLIRADARALPFARRTFSGAYATFPSEYIGDERTLSETLRVLRTTGDLLLVPFAWITGHGLLDRLARRLYSLTGQSPAEPPSDWPPLESDGSQVDTSFVKLKRATVMLVRIHPRLDVDRADTQTDRMP
jgi:ubiquinone/menaquinone biosynthesis C-methylase UbiE